MKKDFRVLAVLALLLIAVFFFVLPEKIQAASTGDLTFELNSNGDGYIVSGCNESASGELVIPAIYNGLPITAIDAGAFMGCTGLTSIIIPDSVNSVGSSAFKGCTGLTNIVIPDRVTTIDNWAFQNCTALTNVTLGNGVTSIGIYAFQYCTNLTQLTISDSVTNVGYLAFDGCTIKKLIIAEGSKIVTYAMVVSESTLEEVVIPNSVTTIDSWAFEGCRGLTSISIPNSVTTIYREAFDGCTGLTNITIPRSVTSISVEIFAGCTGLTQIQVEQGNAVYHSVDNCIIETDSKTLVAGCKTSQIPTDGSVTTIGGGAFFGCNGLTSITIPDSVTSIGDYAFRSCTGLTSITIPDSVTSIGGYAFRGCNGLTSVTYCGTQEQWDAIEKGDYNEPLDNATIQFHNIENGICSFCGKTECEALGHDWIAADCETPKTCNRCQATEEAPGHKYENGICSVCQNYAVYVSVSNSALYRGDTVIVTVSVPAIEHCVIGGFLFDFDTNIFEYVNGEALVSGYSSAGVSTANGQVAGYFMSGEETVQGEIFQITLRVKDNAAFIGNTISGIASFTVNVDGAAKEIACEVSGATVTIACRHSYGEWIPIDEVWHKHICTICSFEETLYVEYSVTFQYADGTVISSEPYHYGDTIVVPDAPPAQAANQKFIGWDKEITTCTGDATYTAVFEEYAPGDINGDKKVDHNDAIYLLLHTMFGAESYPLNGAEADIDGNGTVEQEDAIYLLLHTLFGEVFYPLKG